jgi:glycerol-3-phosphate dehydrogenase
VTPEQVVWSYSGVRPLLDDAAGDPSAVTRDYLLDLDSGQAPLLTVWGGKITTFRKLAEEAVDLLADSLKLSSGPWTRDAPLPGGDLSPWIGDARRPDTDFARFVQALALRHPEWPAALTKRLARAYGARIDRLLEGGGLGPEVVPGLHEAELNYLHRHEWARSADDVLWRRSKLGLHLSAAERARIEAWCTQHWSTADAVAPSERSWN